MQQFARTLSWIWDHTLNSVKFGILLMVLLALYVAVGSTWTGLRAYFEVSDAAFFNAWPMVALALLLVANLVVVTFERIPFTPPRYGVWTVHAGIVTLVFGMVFYFTHKTEGLTLVRVGETVDWYHDAFERSLYVKADRRKAAPIPLADLPRFNAYAPQLGNAGVLNTPGLRGLVPAINDYDADQRKGVPRPVSDLLGLDAATPLTLDVIAYYPYAVVGATYEEADVGKTGLRLTLTDPVSGEERVQWCVAGDGGQGEETLATIRLRHLHREDALVGESLLSAAQAVHSLKWSVRGESGDVTVEPGQTVELGGTGYKVEGVEFLPAFPMFGTGEPADTLELLVHPPADAPFPQTFRRYLLDGRPTQTDFVLDAEGAGPKGKRQETPVDADLMLAYAHTDGLDLLPRGGETERHTFLTKPDRPGLWQLVASNTAPAALHYDEDGTLPLRIDGAMPDPRHQGMMVPRSLHLDIERVAHVRRREFVQEVPPELRDNDKAMGGSMQVATVRARLGDWQQIVQVPFSPWPDQAPWEFGLLRLPGSDEPVQLQLGNTRRPMPASVTLDGFELVPYAGDFTSDSAMRDFKSHLSLRVRGDDEARPETAHLNNPVYFDYKAPTTLGRILPGQSWLLYQNQWDPDKQSFTVLGVGNRPGIVTMIVGCVLIVLGTLYAFYVKPLIIARMKAKALAASQRR